MKTLKTLLTSALTVILLSATAFASTAADKVVDVTATAANPEIKKLIVTGNVNVLLVQSKTEWVSMEEDQMDKVTLKQIGHTLQISSQETQPVTVTVYVNDIYRIDASNTACVKTVGNFKLKYLQLLLRDNATARVRANTESLYTMLDGKAKLELVGSTGNHILKSGDMAILNTEKFAALLTNEMTPDADVAMNKESAKLRNK